MKALVGYDLLFFFVCVGGSKVQSLEVEAPEREITEVPRHDKMLSAHDFRNFVSISESTLKIDSIVDKRSLNDTNLDALGKLRNSSKEQNSRQLDDEVTVECVVSEIHGLFPPEEGNREESIYGCSSDVDDSTYFFNGDPTTLLGEKFISGDTLLSVSLNAFKSDGLIDIEQASIPGSSAVTLLSENSTRRRRLTQTGSYDVLVIRVESSDGSVTPNQSEAQMANDVFEDEHNLAKGYDECSNGLLQFQPASGNGVITVKTNETLNGMGWRTCGTIALDGAGSIDRDYTMIVCPSVVDFGGAAAWGQLQGTISWYKSTYASVPIVQIHEIGHNLGHRHSGQSGVEYADPTCNMGNQGSWTDSGSKYCFNAAKTYANGWYSAYHHTMDPSTEEFDCKMYGINAVRDGTISGNGKVVIKLQGQGEKDLYLMFQRKAGANSQIPQYGDKVVITEQQSTYLANSSWQAALGEGESFSFGWGSGLSEIKVCDINLQESYAKIVVGESGQVPCNQPSNQPSLSTYPSNQPSNIPSSEPSLLPSDQPSLLPSSMPSDIPSDVPSDQPSLAPSDVPSDIPSDSPSDQPSGAPSNAPSDIPSDNPSISPSPTFPAVLITKQEVAVSFTGLSGALTKAELEEIIQKLETISKNTLIATLKANGMKIDPDNIIVTTIVKSSRRLRSRKLRSLQGSTTIEQTLTFDAPTSTVDTGAIGTGIADDIVSDNGLVAAGITVDVQLVPKLERKPCDGVTCGYAGKCVLSETDSML
ncbi:hypothetical protein CTEN210_03990 [Chaetoceros tenuissimus]|uniref:Peptidase M11 gametolysin domain-containing protein n=1 Tax=Chaetoceros tenuissimus TaxID=426638 RepID=A0AAD3CLY4_9STRA|nr:hypothetical protein CTEN210_03990 [Chaetoceros tenuissimus]